MVPLKCKGVFGCCWRAGAAFGKRQRDSDAIRSTARLWGVGCLFAWVTFKKVALKFVVTLLLLLGFNLSFLFSLGSFLLETSQACQHVTAGRESPWLVPQIVSGVCFHQAASAPAGAWNLPVVSAFRGLFASHLWEITRVTQRGSGGACTS